MMGGGGSCLAPSKPLTLQPPHLLRHCTAEPFPWPVGLKLLVSQRSVTCGFTICSSQYRELCRPIPGEEGKVAGVTPLWSLF